MAYLRVDEMFLDRLEIARLSDKAFRLHFSAMLYLTRFPDLEWHLPDVCEKFLRRVEKCRPKHTDELIAGGLWTPEADGFRIAKVHRPKQVGRPRIPTATRVAVFSRDNHACVICGEIEGLSIDHIHPFSLGGGDHIDNLRTLCRPCNSRRGAGRMSDEELRDGR